MALAGGKFDFDRISYQGPKNSKRSRHITKDKILGLDSESGQDGKTLVLAVSDGTVVSPQEWPRKLLTYRFRGKHFLTWNLSFEEGAIFQLLPVEERTALWKKQEVEYEGVVYKNVPGKYIQITMPRKREKGKKRTGVDSRTIHIWDLAPFFMGSLEKNAEKFLKLEKAHIDYDTLTAESYLQNKDGVDQACVQHAKLTHLLGDYLLDTLDQMGVCVNSLYSQASLAAEYFARECGVEDVKEYWRKEKDLLRLACESYRGGKFEMTERGFFQNLYMYDVISAYPAAMSILPGLKHSYTLRQKEIPDGEILYGFLRCRVAIKKLTPHSVGLRKGNLRIYPVGQFFACLTYPEYVYLLEVGASLEVYDAYWIMQQEGVAKYYPYADIIAKLVKLKDEYRLEPMKYKLIKIILNGFYGKLVQLIADGEGNIKAGPYWNPIFGSYITAICRLMMSEVQAEYGQSCKAVHTDSVILDRELAENLQGSALGNYKLEGYGSGLLVFSGSYQVAGKLATRGFRFRPVCKLCGTWNFSGLEVCPCGGGYELYDWHKLLKTMGGNSIIKVQEYRPITWREALHRNTPELTNKFERVEKALDLNTEYKRVWDRPATGNELLQGTISSRPHILFETKPYWEKKDMEH